jgi:hypothetical protein
LSVEKGGGQFINCLPPFQPHRFYQIMLQTVLYEITAAVNVELIKKYEKYMREQHIPDLLETGFFVGAKFTRSSENRYRIVYEALDQESLDEYLEKEAPRLRADFQRHFPAGIELSRENWVVLEEW